MGKFTLGLWKAYNDLLKCKLENDLKGFIFCIPLFIPHIFRGLVNPLWLMSGRGSGWSLHNPDFMVPTVKVLNWYGVLVLWKLPKTVMND